ncbi:MAG TPA: hypothetical protein VF604_08650 [Pyrinomonadaceae bacterium]|jgi:hypothetical protein
MNKIEPEMPPIVYSGYYDAPLAFVVEYKESVYLFWRGGFDDDIDDYPSDYEISLIKEVSFEEIKNQWEIMTNRKYIGRIHFKEIKFDATKRKYISSEIFTKIL